MNTGEKSNLKYGVLTAFSFIVYFMLLKTIGLSDHAWLRFFNAFLLGVGIYSSIRSAKKIGSGNVRYFNGVKDGLVTGIVATLVFVAFMTLYMYGIDTDFHKRILKQWFDEYTHGPILLLFLLLVEGISSSFILTLLVMQKEKTNWNSRFSKKTHQNA
ncbi:DUF4199 domain-containing protein [Neptunitalea lumnitzerae]|uniref:DUF4199 domain-containing protein n=1 Tax=Neptunitalea lumnitzerae TaxID=2965509 RepID=A0ABQ5MG72_9FLAO|nr:DUF4199 domain-containing protein [Neptunitalea sp. Y10]GLB48403.1 hypothetical protein Y10_07710 [Neptunitalea sp. Y10]